MNIKFHNSLTRQTETFKPLKKNKVGLYTCGPTVYNYAHIGNLRTYVFEDILKRVLKFNGYKVKHIMNITDVGHLTDDADTGEEKLEKSNKDALYLKCKKCDKTFFSGIIDSGKNTTFINNTHQCPRCGYLNLAKNNSYYFKINSQKNTIWDIAKFYTQAFKNDLKDLNIEEPNKWCPATKYIKEQIALIKKLEANGFTYKTSDGIYFDTSKLKDYGKMANLQNQKLQAGARVDLGEKKNHTDFALWKFSPSGEKRQMEWNSPWGIGFPGWHIECSAMSTKYLGQPFDIHCGGIDHIPVHHTNEIAQSESANGKPLANYWLHGEFLLIDEGKMAKSEGNFITLKTLKEKNINPLAYRYFLLQAHYRKQLNFTWEALGSAQNGLDHLYRAVAEIGNWKLEIGAKEKLKNKFLEYINDDLNLPGAMGLIWERINKKQIDYKTLLEFDKILGLNIKKNIKKLSSKKLELPEEIKKIILERDLARQNKDFKKSDELRAKLETLGYEVNDTKDGTNVIEKN